MKRIVFATGNEGKMKEIRMILADLQVSILSMKEAGLQTDVEENGKSFAENADGYPEAFSWGYRSCR